MYTLFLFLCFCPAWPAGCVVMTESALPIVTVCMPVARELLPNIAEHALQEKIKMASLSL